MQCDSTTLWLVMLAMGAGTFLIRFSFIWLLGRGAVRPGLQRTLRFVPASVLSALVWPSLFFPQHLPFSLGNDRMWAGLIAALVAWRTRSVVLTIVAGMASLWALMLV